MSKPNKTRLCFLAPFYWEKNNKMLFGINRKTNRYPSKVFLMPARASFDTLTNYLSCWTGSLYRISKKRHTKERRGGRKKLKEANNVERCFIPLLTCSVVHSTGYFSLSPQPVLLDQYYLETLGQQGLTLAAKKKERQKEKNKRILNSPFVIQNQNKLFVVGCSLVVRFKISF